MEKDLTCGICDMVFHSAEGLQKHKALLCIGTKVRGGFVEVEQRRIPDLLQVRDQQQHANKPRSEAEVESDSGVEHKPATSQTDTAAALQNLTQESLGPQSTRHPLGQTERLKQMRDMAAEHEQHLGLIHRQNQQLQQQREELMHQVSVLCEQTASDRLEALLLELKEQEERNEETLQQFAEHLRRLQEQKVPVAAAQPDSSEKKNIQHDDSRLLPPVDGSLSAQIRALRQAYMHSGGSEPGIVAQMIDLQAEAQSLEKNQAAASAKSRRKREKPHLRGSSLELLILEQENQRLEMEILRFQRARERHRDYEAAAVRTEVELMERENLQQVVGSQAGVERNRAATRTWRQPPPPLQPPSPPPPPVRSFFSASGRHITDKVDSLGPSPYDPAGGFVVFYDLVLGVDASHKALRLVASLYVDGLEVGPPTLLQTVKCLPATSLSYTHHNPTMGNHALLSVKQPVPRVQPSPSLCLVMEVQAASDLDVHNQEVKLTSVGWTRLDLFDCYNQLRSGHWRVPVRSLPVKPSLSIAQLNSIPQVGNMELCLRLVNSRDGDLQTLMDPDPDNSRHYKYPVIWSPFYTSDGNSAARVSSPQPLNTHQLPSSAQEIPKDESNQS